MKGIILAGGSGTRLHPVTRAVSKQLLPIFNKPMIYYPLSSLMFAGIKEILIITTPEDQESFKRLLGDGSDLGMDFQYAVQPSPDGLAQAFLIGSDFIGDSPVALALGDNVFFGHNVPRKFRTAGERKEGATVFAYHVQDPQRYGVVEFDKDGKVKSLVEKPKQPKSSFAVTGIYFYDNKVVEHASKLKPSPRGELEITDLNIRYLNEDKLFVELLGRGSAWLDTGTHSSLLQASEFVQTIEERQGLLVGCVEEVAYRMQFISARQLEELAQPLLKSGYGEYLLQILREEENGWG